MYTIDHYDTHLPELPATTYVASCGPDISRTRPSSDLCFTHDIPLINVSIQLPAQVPTRPRSPRIKSVPGPYDMSHRTRRNVTWFSLF